MVWLSKSGRRNLRSEHVLWRGRSAMATRSLMWNAEQLPQGVLRVAFTGQGGIGSEGNQDGQHMTEAIRQALAEYRPTALIIDLCDFEYRFGDWIGSPAVTAMQTL